jgi:hypothetical protein
VQGAQLHNDEEQEDDHWPSGVREVLQALPLPPEAQRNEVREQGKGTREQKAAASASNYSLIPVPFSLAFRGVSSTVKLSVSKTELESSNLSAPARFERDISGCVPESRRK